MSHELLIHCAAVALCRRSAWVGDWRDLCATRRDVHDGERFKADGGEKIFEEKLGPMPNYQQPGYKAYWEARGKLFERYRLIEITKDIRLPPLPFKSDLGVRPAAGCCRVCGQPIYRGRSWKPSAGARHAKAQWHAYCFAAYRTWQQPSGIANWLAARQGGFCAYSGAVIAQWVELAPNDFRRAPAWGGRTHEWRLLPDVEVDHFIPLWRVARMVVSWPRVLNYWGPVNLRAVTATAHKAKSRREASERARLRLELTEQGEWYV